MFTPRAHPVAVAPVGLALAFTLACRHDPETNARAPASAPSAAVAVVDSPPERSADAGPDADPRSASAGTPAVTAAPDVPPPPPSLGPGATALVARELLVGMLPSPGRRTTWRLEIDGGRVLLRIEAAKGERGFEHLEASSLDDAAWGAPVMLVYEGVVEQPAPLSVKLRLVSAPRNIPPRTFFVDPLPTELRLACARKTVPVHPANARLVRGPMPAHSDMAPSLWKPPAVQAIAVTGCTSEPDTLQLPFTKALAFVPVRDVEERPALEWAFENSDMVMQDGGYRATAAKSAVAPPAVPRSAPPRAPPR